MKERKRNRLRGFDYSSDNLYFITTCVQDRVCCFGEIRHMRKDGNVNDDMDGNFDGRGRDRSRPVPTSSIVPSSSSAPSWLVTSSSPVRSSSYVPLSSLVSAIFSFEGRLV